MKPINFPATFSIALVVMLSCQKPASDTTAGQATLKSSSAQITPGQSVYFTVQKGTPGAVSTWTVTPSTAVIIDRVVSWNQSNNIRFNQAGTFTVNVELKKVWCDSAAAANPGMDTCLNSGTVTARTSAVIIVKN